MCDDLQIMKKGKNSNYVQSLAKKVIQQKQYIISLTVKLTTVVVSHFLVMTVDQKIATTLISRKNDGKISKFSCTYISTLKLLDVSKLLYQLIWLI